jgi:hypothetical protein
MSVATFLKILRLSSKTRYIARQMDAKERGGAGQEPGKSEVSGRTQQLLYECFNCGAQNYVDPDWTWFVCWKCGLQKPLPLRGH